MHLAGISLSSESMVVMSGLSVHNGWVGEGPVLRLCVYWKKTAFMLK